MPVSIQSFEQGHTSTLEYTLDWTDWIKSGEAVHGEDEIVASTWTASPDTLDIGDGDPTPAPSFFQVIENGVTKHYSSVWIKDPVLHKTYLLTNRITTALGRVEERTITIKGVDR